MIEKIKFKMDHRFSVIRVENGVDASGIPNNENSSSLDTSEVSSSTSKLYDIKKKAEKRKKSLAQYYREAFPRLENYRISKRASKRPSLGQLHGGDEASKVCFFFV